MMEDGKYLEFDTLKYSINNQLDNLSRTIIKLKYDRSATFYVEKERSRETK
jgi:hypothetical protein